MAVLVFAFVWLENALTFSLVPEIKPKQFDQKQWVAWSTDDMRQSEDIRRAYARRDMLEDLLSKYNFTGWKLADLKGLLGPGTPEFCPQEWDLAYLLGLDWVDYVVLVFRLDENGKVESYQVTMF
jgi:hypothetical protein